MHNQIKIEDNPLLQQNELPLFSSVTSAHVMPAINYLITQNETILKSLLENKNYTFENLVLPLETMEEKLNQVWNVISHLDAVKNTHDFHEAYDKALAILTEYYTKLYQNEALYQAFVAVSKQNPHKIIENALRDFRLSGILLAEDEKIRFKKISIELSELESRFEQNVLLATEKWSLLIEEKDKERLKGIQDTDIQVAKQLAESKQQNGYVFSLQYPSYHAIMTYAEDRELRKTVYQAYVTRASELSTSGQEDNGPIMLEILQLRQQLATLLNFHDYAEYALEKRLAKTPAEVFHFIETLSSYTKPKAIEEIEELKAFALQSGIKNLEPWDLAYYSEKLMQKKFNLSEEDLKAYFSLHKVIEGLFGIAESLFGIKIKEIFVFDKWQENVRLFEVYDAEGHVIGKFYIDLFSRENKQEGAWVSDYKRRMVYGDIKQIPISFLTTNFSSAADSEKSCLTHDEVITLFHEFGHCLHQVLTKADYPSLSGTSNVALDAVEFPSQFMENWCWEKAVLQQLSSHVLTGDRLSSEMIMQMNMAKNFQFGMQMQRQLEFALFDFKIHVQKKIENVRDIQAILDKVRECTAVFAVPAFNRFQNTFSHIFGGSYAAGYYSYTWADIMACDAFLKFKEAGLLNSKTGMLFLSTILSKGGTESMMTLFIAFRGRKPTMSAFLEHYDLIGQK